MFLSFYLIYCRKLFFNSPLSRGLLNPETSGVADRPACPELVEGGVFSTAQTVILGQKIIDRQKKRSILLCKYDKSGENTKKYCFDF
jgi:hypothetical protein